MFQDVSMYDPISFAQTLNEADFLPLSPPIHAHKYKQSLLNYL